MFTLRTCFKPLFLKVGGGDPLVEVTVNSKEVNSKDFCPNYVQEFGLRFFAIILRDLRLEVSIYNFYITTQFQTILLKGGEKIH